MNGKQLNTFSMPSSSQCDVIIHSVYRTSQAIKTNYGGGDDAKWFDKVFSVRYLFDPLLFAAAVRWI